VRSSKKSLSVAYASLLVQIVGLLQTST